MEKSKPPLHRVQDNVGSSAVTRQAFSAMATRSCSSGSSPPPPPPLAGYHSRATSNSTSGSPNKKPPGNEYCERKSRTAANALWESHGCVNCRAEYLLRSAAYLPMFGHPSMLSRRAPCLVVVLVRAKTSSIAIGPSKSSCHTCSWHLQITTPLCLSSVLRVWCCSWLVLPRVAF